MLLAIVSVAQDYLGEVESAEERMEKIRYIYNRVAKSVC